MIHRLSLAFLGAVVALQLAAGPVRAETAACAEIRAELLSLDRRAGSYDPYGDAVAKQRAALERGQAEYQRQCTPGFLTGVSPRCPAIAERVQAMQANLAKLEKHGTTSAPARNDGARQRLTAQLQQNRCNEAPALSATYGRPPPNTLSVGGPTQAPTAQARPTQNSNGRVFTLPGPNGPVAYREEPGGRIVQLGPVANLGGTPDDPYALRPKRGGPIQVPLFGDTPPGVDDPYAADPRAATDPSAAEPGGSYRTLCVRTCDGYYFPISYAASRNQFANDTDVCRARCPGTETRLYVHRNPGEDSEDSVAADDPSDHYSKQPNALRYRREVVAGCTCGRADPSLLPLTASSEEDRTKSGAVKIGDVREGLPVPDRKPPAGEDPETLANFEADFVPHVIEPPTRTEANLTPIPAGPKSVRVVGPKFFADR